MPTSFKFIRLLWFVVVFFALILFMGVTLGIVDAQEVQQEVQGEISQLTWWRELTLGEPGHVTGSFNITLPGQEFLYVGRTCQPGLCFSATALVDLLGPEGEWHAVGSFGIQGSDEDVPRWPEVPEGSTVILGRAAYQVYIETEGEIEYVCPVGLGTWSRFNVGDAVLLTIDLETGYPRCYTLRRLIS